ncbi:HTH-type transcriptional regulator HdfR [Halomonadaceae bacterium LMG 33818]|uniref:LysR family transcriptional regulator n=1 Tax=Cernens ardua TaxID=3402176 RepID=UPI003EDBAA2B
MTPFSKMLIYFVEVAKHGSIRKASEYLNVSASAIDRQILNAEEQLGVTLFSRSSQGMQLSPAGEALMKGAQDWQRQYSSICRHIDDLSGYRRGKINIGVIGATSRQILPDVLEEMRKRFPGIFTEVSVLSNEEVGRGLVEGRLDLGLMLNPSPLSDIAVILQREVRLGVCVPAGHELSHRESIRFADLVQYHHDVILPGAPLQLHYQFKMLEEAAGVTIKGMGTSNTIELTREMILRGIGISILGELDVESPQDAGRIHFIPLKDKILQPGVLGLCYPRKCSLTHAMSMFIDIFHQQIKWLRTDINGEK